MNTGEDERGLRKILDMTRLMSLVLLGLHFYYSCYAAFSDWGLTASLSDNLLRNVRKSGLFDADWIAKSLSLGMLVISLFGAKGKKEENLSLRSGVAYFMTGLVVYWTSVLVFGLKMDRESVALSYMSVTGIGFIFMLTGGTYLSRVIKLRLNGKDIFNKENESFPQEERLLQNEYSVNLPTQYHVRGKRRKGWINIINPFRALLVLGSPGSGKSYFVIQHVIRQHIEKGFAMLVYDFKFDDLSKIAYNIWLKNQDKYKAKSACFFIDFDRIIHRCNPLEPASMEDITDAAESARTIMLGLNREWIKKQGDFFVESPINFLTAIIWYLRKYQDGEYCTLPHVIELMQVDYDRLFTILRTEKEIEALINPFVSAYLNDVMEQLEGQIAAAKISMARLVSPALYYVLSGNDFSLDINNPEEPKIVCLGNNPQKQQVYGAVLSLYVSRLIKTVNRKGKLKCSLIFDEFPTIYLNNIDSLIATARSNKVATTLGLQDFSQLKKDYGKDQADVIMNITGNVISGQVTGETAKQLSDRFGKIMQDRSSISINRSDTSISHSKQLDSAVPASKISGLSSGVFVGSVADDPTELIEQKLFHATIVNNHDLLKREADVFLGVPSDTHHSSSVIQLNYEQISKDVENIVDSEMSRIWNDPVLRSFLVKK